MYPFSCGFLCERDILLVRDREEDMETDRYVFFSETSTSQHHNVVLHNTHTLTNTNTHTHMPGQLWLAGPVVPEDFFFGFCKYFLTTSGQQEFFRPPGGHATYENIILRELIVSFCLYFYAGIMLQGFVIRI